MGFTEKARRVMFFARYEASQLGCTRVEPEQILLGLLREDKAIAARFVGPSAEVESIRKQIVDRVPTADKLSCSVDIPLSKSSKAVLAHTEKEQVRMGSVKISPEHLLIGLLQQGSLAAELLQERGLTVQKVREQLENPVPSQPAQVGKRTACKDCRHLVVDGELDQFRSNMFCVASPKEPEFDCYTGEFTGEASGPDERYEACVRVNFGNCRLFEPKQEGPQLTPRG